MIYRNQPLQMLKTNAVYAPKRVEKQYTKLVVEFAGKLMLRFSSTNAE